MPYAADEMLCTSKLDNGKEISEKEYCDAVRAVEEGAKVKIVDGEVTLLWREEKTLYNVIDGQSDVFELWPDEDFPETISILSHQVWDIHIMKKLAVGNLLIDFQHYLG